MNHRIKHRRNRERTSSVGRVSFRDTANHLVVKSGVDAATAATKTAHGQTTIEARRGLISARASETASRVSLAQVVDSVAIEVNALLGRMRLIAHRGSEDTRTADQYELLQQEFEMLQDEMELLVAGAGKSVRTLNTASAPATFHDIAPAVLKIDRTHARVDSKGEAEWALFLLDSAEEAVVRMSDEFGTIDDRLDAALDALDAFIESIGPSKQPHRTATDAMAAAQRTRLQLMQSEGVDTVAASPDFQRSVSALLQ